MSKRTSVWIYGRLYQSLETMPLAELTKLKALAKKEMDRYEMSSIPATRPLTHHERQSQHYVISLMRKSLGVVSALVSKRENDLFPYAA